MIRSALPDWLFLVEHYWHFHRRLPNIFRPKTFTEKVLHRLIFRREAWMTRFSDKYRVREYVSERLGTEILPELYHITDRPELIPFDSLPQRFVVKPTHGSGWVQVVHDKSHLDRDALIATCRSWLGQSYYKLTREWIYRDIKPQILIEELVDDGNGGTPHDYKLSVFDGRVAFILVTMGRFKERAHIFLDRDWNPVDVAFSYSKVRRLVPPPPHLQEMIEAAETLADGVNFIRVDFYDTEDKLFFGELTVAPGGGFDRFEPPSFDRQLGAIWNRVSKPRGRFPVLNVTF